MPLEIDPAWEYWEPDPEVAEAMGGDTVAPIGRLFGGMGRGSADAPYRTGFRFGRASGGDRRLKVRDEGLFRRMWDGGSSTADIMAAFGISNVGTVRRWRVRLGLVPRGAGRPPGRNWWPPVRSASPKAPTAPSISFDAEVFRRMWGAGAPYRQIADLFGVEAQTVFRWRVKYNLEPRATGNHHRPRVALARCA